jgi:hypothetical protein
MDYADFIMKRAQIRRRCMNRKQITAPIKQNICHSPCAVHSWADSSKVEIIFHSDVYTWELGLSEKCSKFRVTTDLTINFFTSSSYNLNCNGIILYLGRYPFSVLLFWACLRA